VSGDRRANGWVRLSPGRRQVLAVLRDEQWHDESKLTNSGTAWRMVQDGLIERDPARRGVNLYSYVTPYKARVRITAFGMSVNDDSNDKARFLSYISEQLPNGCVRWLGSKGPKGQYGAILFRGKVRKAHHVAFFLIHDRFPMGEGRHLCNNDWCVAGEHIAEGTHKQNMEDMRRSGRAAKGERHHCCRLSDRQIAEMRARSAAGESNRALGRAFGVNHSHVSRVCSGKKRKENNSAL
jgi:hypothetical protein